jgi:hypothetical protein
MNASKPGQTIKNKPAWTKKLTIQGFCMMEADDGKG